MNILNDRLQAVYKKSLTPSEKWIKFLTTELDFYPADPDRMGMRDPSIPMVKGYDNFLVTYIDTPSGSPASIYCSICDSQVCFGSCIDHSTEVQGLDTRITPDIDIVVETILKIINELL